MKENVGARKSLSLLCVFKHLTVNHSDKYISHCDSVFTLLYILKIKILRNNEYCGRATLIFHKIPSLCFKIVGKSHDVDFQTHEWVLTHHLENVSSHEVNFGTTFWRHWCGHLQRCLFPSETKSSNFGDSSISELGAALIQNMTISREHLHLSPHCPPVPFLC